LWCAAISEKARRPSQCGAGAKGGVFIPMVSEACNAVVTAIVRQSPEGDDCAGGGRGGDGGWGGFLTRRFLARRRIAWVGLCDPLRHKRRLLPARCGPHHARPKRDPDQSWHDRSPLRIVHLVNVSALRRFRCFARPRHDRRAARAKINRDGGGTSMRKSDRSKK